MSYLDTKQACIDVLINNLPTGVTSDDIAYEAPPEPFNPEGKDSWVAVYFNPVSSEPMGKNVTDNDSQRGFFQVSVFVKLSSDNYDNTQLQICDEVLSAFPNSSFSIYNTQKVCFLNSTLTNGSESDAWFKRDITINYLTTSNRG